MTIPCLGLFQIFYRNFDHTYPTCNATKIFSKSLIGYHLDYAHSQKRSLYHLAHTGRQPVDVL